MINFYSHRARDSHNFKDNSKEAINFVLSKSYIAGVELDIRLTKDKKLVIYHNPFVILNNKIKVIYETKYVDLYKANIYKLKDILAFLNTNKRIILEVKYENKFNKKDADLIIDEVSKYNLDIYLCSFNTKLIKYIKKNSNLKCGIIIGSMLNRFKSKLDFCLIKYSLVFKTPKYEYYIWTINDNNLLNKIKKKTKNINIITDNAYKFNNIHQSH